MDNKKRKKSFWMMIAAVVCILIYIIIPVLKITGVIESYNSAVTTFFVIAGAVLYLAGRKMDMNDKEKEDDPSKHFEDNEKDAE